MTVYESIVETKYMVVTLIETKPKTVVYKVESKRGDFLGTIKWFSNWRQYCYFPATEIIMAKSCLKDLCEFIEKLMNDRRS